MAYPPKRSISSRKWSDLTDRQRRAVVALGVVQVGLATAAWADLAMRPGEEIRGRKGVWAGIIAVNFIGPVWYFSRGIERP